MNKRLQAWIDASRVYWDRRMITMLFLGFSSGLPFGILAEPLTAWLFQAGVSKTDIGLFALVSLPWAFKFLWAPVMDHARLPGLNALFGQRRSWALLTQVLLLASILIMSTTEPGIDPWWTALFALCVSFFSASQDIVIDAYRIERLSEDELAAGSAVWTTGWRVAQAGGAAFALIAAQFYSWEVIFSGLGILVVVGILAILLSPEPKRPVPKDDSMAAKFERAVVGPFKDFFSRPYWLMILLFIALYKYGDAVLSVMKVPFFLEIGFTTADIGAVAKVFGLVAILSGGLIGGIVLKRFGLMRGLLICGLLMAFSNLIFILQAFLGPERWALVVTIGVENVTTGMGTVAFVAFVSALCHKAYTATQFALFTSMMAGARTVLSSGAGWLADQTDWISFFIITTLLAIPGLALLLALMKLQKGHADLSKSQSEKS